MSKKLIVTGIGGFVVGVGAMMLTAFSAAPKLMIVEDESRYAFEETIERVEATATEHGWKVPTVHMLHDAVTPYGYEVGRVAVLELCQPHHAAKILAEDRAKVVTSLMPCRISVYETSDGRVVVSRMNTHLMAQAFGGTIAKVMADATEENETILKSVLN
ncbi:DUF302 domain-containing protein [Thioalkalivibrio paradoxus]|uniref:DUF302 domain-containing protein n=1 Tax=Thioalkalivibrio paradoxus ARh 1 TaxID=713585 RepID=W0DJC4_9GAMM|nr:DUF302 domain-containing protein [Thioalkalivibrio paradoxus]AHE96990.1 hypothetical protein THITH_00430 [Thioalkalivibrio paradoxus ARh 1]